MSPSVNRPLRRIRCDRAGFRDQLLYREWLVTNGLGGYASGTIAGVLTRRYHGLLIAALPAPHGRTVMLNHLTERLHLPDGRTLQLGGDELTGDQLVLHGIDHMAEFALDSGMPVWRYELDRWTLEKRVLMPYRQNTVHVSYSLLRGNGRLGLDITPSLHFRHHEDSVSAPLDTDYTITVHGDRYEITDDSDLPALRFHFFADRGKLILEGGRTRQILYRREADRGYDACGTLWCPGHFAASLEAGGRAATLCVSTEPWETILALDPEDALSAERERRQVLLDAAPPAARQGVGAELVLAADAFIITPASRVQEAARMRASGDEARTIIAGYHWFTDWGRDTMISLEGLTLTTGRPHEARDILHTFWHYVREGLIPNLFPEGQSEGRYNTADATLWFFHALHRYVRLTGDTLTLRHMLSCLVSIFDHHMRGTRFGIGVDPEDGLLTQGAEHYALTWMDAKVDDWVVTPRRGKAVEINALWFNALRLLESWLREHGNYEQRARADQVAAAAQKAHESFNRRFWYREGGYLYDIVDGEHGDDASCRPNQIFAISLTHPVLEPERWCPVLERVQETLLTAVGLRSLQPGHEDYKSSYFGDLRARDAAYHQGTVWSWLIGPFIDAYLAVYPDRRDRARGFLAGFEPHLDNACVGSISEIFDAEPPFTPRGCIAQAWGVAEALRAWVLTAEPDQPASSASGE
jgi:predicted glycogen debranching enzyme